MKEGRVKRLRRRLKRWMRRASGRTTEGGLTGAAAEAYYANGWNGLDAFTRETAWQEALRFEHDPDRAFDENGRVVYPAAGRDAFVAQKLDLLRHVCARFEPVAVDYLEFGVRGGTSLRAVSEQLKDPDTRLYGFDTFAGLPESWVTAWGRRDLASGGTGLKERGSFSVKQIPEFADPRVALVKGTFQATLGDFLASHPLERPKVVNIDSDLYSAALFVLTRLHPVLAPGDRIYFDEFYDPLNEFAAFNDFVRSHYLKDRFVLIGRAYDACAFEIVGP